MVRQPAPLTPDELYNAVRLLDFGRDPDWCRCSYCQLRAVLAMAETLPDKAPLASYLVRWHYSPAVAKLRDNGCDCPPCELHRLLVGYVKANGRKLNDEQMAMAFV